jgi:hypothetical protein
VPYAVLLQKSQVLEERLSGLRSQEAAPGLTPGKEGRMKILVSSKKDELNMLLGLHVSA